MKVVTSVLIPEREPVIKISSKIELPPKFRKEFDEWLLERFGTKSVFFIVSGGPTGADFITMHPNNLQAVKAEINNERTIHPNAAGKPASTGNAEQNRIPHSTQIRARHSHSVGLTTKGNNGVYKTNLIA